MKQRKIYTMFGALILTIGALLLMAGCNTGSKAGGGSKTGGSGNKGPILTLNDTGNLAVLNILTLDKANKKGTFSAWQNSNKNGTLIDGEFEIKDESNSKKFVTTIKNQGAEASDWISSETMDIKENSGIQNCVEFSTHCFCLTPLLDKLK